MTIAFTFERSKWAPIATSEFVLDVAAETIAWADCYHSRAMAKCLDMRLKHCSFCIDSRLWFGIAAISNLALAIKTIKIRPKRIGKEKVSTTVSLTFTIYDRRSKKAIHFPFHALIYIQKPIFIRIKCEATLSHATFMLLYYPIFMHFVSFRPHSLCYSLCPSFTCWHLFPIFPLNYYICLPLILIRCSVLFFLRFRAICCYAVCHSTCVRARSSYSTCARYRDLHLSETADIGELSTKFLVKRASDAIVFLDDNAKETNYEFSWVYHW